MPLPDLEPEQRRQALEKAVEARRVRAELKQMLKAGELTITELLDRAADSDHVARMRVTDVVSAMPGYGKVRTRRLLEELDIAASRRLRGLGPRQRERLLETFGELSGP